MLHEINAQMQNQQQKHKDVMHISFTYKYKSTSKLRTILAMVTRLNFEKIAIFVLKNSQNSHLQNLLFEQKNYCEIPVFHQK